MTHAQTQAPFHCLVWIDHRQAGIYGVSEQGLSELVRIHAPDTGHGHVHHRAGTMGCGHEPINPEFLKAVAAALPASEELLIAGPAAAKHALKQYLAAKYPALDRRIMGVETLPKTNDHEMHVFAHRFFHRTDRMRP